MKKVYILIGLVAIFSLALVSLVRAVAGTLEFVTITPSYSYVANPSDYTVAFTTASTTPSTAQVKLIFPSGFNTASVATTTTLTGFDGIMATSTSSASGTTQVVTLFRADGTDKDAATAVSLNVTGIVNPSAAGSYTMDVETLYLEGDTLEIGTSAAFTISGAYAPRYSNVETSPPSSNITSPTAGATISAGEKYTIKGTAEDSGGSLVQGVEVSLDGGKTWSTAKIKSALANVFPWEYVWQNPTEGEYTIKARATDTVGNIESPSAGVKVTVPAAVPPEEVPAEVPEKPISEMTAQELQAKILEIQQKIIDLLQQLIQLIQQQIQELLT